MPKLEEITCPDFPTFMEKKDGKIICRRFIKGGFCELDKNFQCLEVPNPLGHRFSYTSLSMYLQCRRKFHLKYHEKITPIKEEDWQIRGKAFHSFLAQYYRTGKDPAPNFSDRLHMLAYTMAQEYVTFYHDFEPGMEVELEIDLPGLPHEKTYGCEGYISYIDLIQKDTMFDHKFSASEPSYLSVVLQASMYFRSLQRIERDDIKKFCINFTRVPKHEQKKGESLGELSNRISREVEKEPNKYFNRIYYSKDEFTKWIPQIDRMVEEIWMLKRNPRNFYPSFECSFSCQYEPICLTDQVDTKLFKIYVKKTEATKEIDS